MVASEMMGRAVWDGGDGGKGVIRQTVRGVLAGRCAGFYTRGMLKAVLFDFDGVLVDTEPIHYRAMVRTMASLGAAPSYADYVQRLAGYDEYDCFRLLLQHDCGRPDLAGDGSCVSALCEKKREIFSTVVTQGVDLVPGAKTLVNALSDRVALAIASGGLRRDIDLILGAIGMQRQFLTIVSVDDVARPKPDPQTYDLVCQRLARLRPQLDLTPGACLAIEDTAAGIASANAAGMMTLGVATTSSPRQLSEASHVVDGLEGIDIEQLERWFGEAAPG